MTALIVGASFVFGFLTSAAQTWCLLAIEKRAAVRAAWWDVVICVSSLIVIYTHNVEAFAAYVVGSAWATWWSVRREPLNGVRPDETQRPHTVDGG